tara:strand:- start:441 stop:752 length:312 start_codon:yes stop_codon:yes gene_type:complete
MAKNIQRRYRPDEFQSPVGEVSPYCDTLGKCEYEMVAASLIHASQKAGRWVPIKIGGRLDDLPMKKEGLIEVVEGGVVLTDLALAQIHAKYPAVGINKIKENN